MQGLPPGDPDLTPLIYFLCFIKDGTFFPLLSANVAELRNGIYTAVAEVTPNMLAQRQVETLPYQ